MLMWGKKVGNGKVFSRITCIFGAASQAPAQRAVGDCSPLKESPERGPAARQKIFRGTNVLSIFKKSFKYVQKEF